MAAWSGTWCLVALLWAQYFTKTVHASQLNAPVPVNPPYRGTVVSNAFAFALGKFNADTNGDYNIVSVQSVTEQVVDGKLFRMKYTIRSSAGVEKSCTSTVWYRPALDPQWELIMENACV